MSTNRKMYPIQMANRQLVGLKFRCDSTSSLQEGSDICQSTQYCLRSFRHVRLRYGFPAPHRSPESPKGQRHGLDTQTRPRCKSHSQLVSSTPDRSAEETRRGSKRSFACNHRAGTWASPADMSLSRLAHRHSCAQGDRLRLYQTEGRAHNDCL